MNAYELLRQGDIWVASTGEIPIADMTHQHRDNAIRYLLSAAGRYEKDYTAEEIRRLMERGLAHVWTQNRHPLDVLKSHRDRLGMRRNMPSRFIRSTPLYHALWRANYAPTSPPTPLTEDL